LVGTKFGCFRNNYAALDQRRHDITLTEKSNVDVVVFTTFCRIFCIFFVLDALVNFFSMHSNVFRRIHTQSDLITSHP
jgi:hypothetical protein